MTGGCTSKRPPVPPPHVLVPPAVCHCPSRCPSRCDPQGWDIFVAQQPVLPADHPLFFTSPWTASCNIIMLDHKRVVCEASETPTIEVRHRCLLRYVRLIRAISHCPCSPTNFPPSVVQAFKSWGFTPIPVPFRHFLPFGGSFHCATCDIRRTGELQSYF